MDRDHPISGGRHFRKPVRAVDDVDVRLRVQHLRVVVSANRRARSGSRRRRRPPQMHVGDGVAVRVGGRHGQRAAPPTGSEAGRRARARPRRRLEAARRVAVLRFRY